MCKTMEELEKQVNSIAIDILNKCEKYGKEN